MCIACVKPINVPIPAFATFENCFSVNPDGAGLAYVRDGAVYIRKGLRTISEFRSELDKTIQVLGGPEAATRTPMLFHFRIGTHGSKDDPKHTHPFPLTDDYATMTELHVRTKAAVIHNGIINLGFGKATRPTSYGHWDYETKRWIDSPAEPSDAPSDTMEFIKEVLSPLSDIGPWHTNPKIHTFIRNLAGQSNKIATLFDDGTTLLLGDFIPGPDGLFYSNRSFEARVLPTKTATTFDNWSDDTPLMTTLDYLEAFTETVESAIDAVIATKNLPKALNRILTDPDWLPVDIPMDFWTTKLDPGSKPGSIGQRIMLRCPNSLWFMRTGGKQFAYFSPTTNRIRIYTVAALQPNIAPDGILDASIPSQRATMSLRYYVNQWVKTDKKSWPDYSHYYWDIAPPANIVPLPTTVTP